MLTWGSSKTKWQGKWNLQLFILLEFLLSFIQYQQWSTRVNQRSICQWMFCCYMCCICVVVYADTHMLIHICWYTCWYTCLLYVVPIETVEHNCTHFWMGYFMQKPLFLEDRKLRIPRNIYWIERVEISIERNIEYAKYRTDRNF